MCKNKHIMTTSVHIFFFYNYIIHKTTLISENNYYIYICLSNHCIINYFIIVMYNVKYYIIYINAYVKNYKRGSIIHLGNDV